MPSKMAEVHVRTFSILPRTKKAFEINNLRTANNKILAK